MSLFPKEVSKKKPEIGGNESSQNPSISCVAFSISKKKGRLFVLRTIEIEDGIVTRYTETVPDSRDVCLVKAEEALIEDTEKK